MSNPSSRTVHWIFWPFQVLWRLLTWVLELTGRLILGILGFSLVALGILVSLSVIGAILGIPMILLGILMMLRAVFN